VVNGCPPAGKRPSELIRSRSLPAFLHLLAAPASETTEFALTAEWPECVVALESTTLSPRGIVAPNRAMSLPPAMTLALQDALVRFTSVRGWGDIAAAQALRGKSIIDVRKTVEMVPGPARLAKVVLDGPGAARADKITVVCGWRPAGASQATSSALRAPRCSHIRGAQVSHAFRSQPRRSAPASNWPGERFRSS
jgi:hypothetical protein